MKEFDHICPCLRRSFLFCELSFLVICFAFCLLGGWSLLIDLREPFKCEENWHFIYVLSCKVSFSVYFLLWFLLERHSAVKSIFLIFLILSPAVHTV